MTQKTIKLSDIYVKKSDLHIPTKTSDLTNDGNNGSSPFATLDNLPIVPTANTTASNIKMNGSQSAGNLDTYAKADHVHPSDSTKASTTHTHTGWVKKKEIGSTSNTLHVALFVNESLHMCYLRWWNAVFSVTAGYIYGGTEHPWTATSVRGSWVPETYRPTYTAAGAITWGTLFVTPDGKLQATFTRSTDNVVNLYGSVMWIY